VTPDLKSGFRIKGSLSGWQRCLGLCWGEWFRSNG